MHAARGRDAAVDRLAMGMEVWLRWSDEFAPVLAARPGPPEGIYDDAVKMRDEIVVAREGRGGPLDGPWRSHVFKRVPHARGRRRRAVCSAGRDVLVLVRRHEIGGGSITARFLMFLTFRVLVLTFASGRAATLRTDSWAYTGKGVIMMTVCGRESVEGDVVWRSDDENGTASYRDCQGTNELCSVWSVYGALLIHAIHLEGRGMHR